MPNNRLYTSQRVPLEPIRGWLADYFSRPGRSYLGVAAAVGMEETLLRRWVKGKNKTAALEDADHFFTKIGRPDLIAQLEVS